MAAKEDSSDTWDDLEKLKALKELGDSDEIPDPEQVKEILKAVGEEIPALLNAVKDALYSPESAKQFAESIGTFYTELINQGIPEEMAMEMTEKYASSLNIGHTFSSSFIDRKND